jgi:corrinoid protein of di/trimethylamine methyltransferase
MARSKTELLKMLSDGVFEMSEDGTRESAEEYAATGYPASDGIMKGLADGMSRAGALYETEEYFVTDLLLCSDAMYAGLDVLRPYLEAAAAGGAKKKAVIGVVEGDTHDIGKNLVKIMLETAGFELFDLGRDVAPEKFVETAKRENAELICLSTLMTTTMSGMKTVVDLLEGAGMRDKVKVIVGGGPVSQRFSDKIGADGYSPNAVEAVKLAKKVLQVD